MNRIRTLRIPAILAFAFVSTFPLLSWAIQPVPPLRGRVNDYAQLLTPEQRARLESVLAQFEARKGSQIAVLMVPTTKPETIEQYGIRVSETWKLGRKGVDDGILLLVATEDHAVRIEVGYGLEGILPDAIAKRIIEDEILPLFRTGEFYRGITAGLERIMATIAGEALPVPSPVKNLSGKSQGLLVPVLAGIFLGWFLQVILGRFWAGLLGGGLVGFLVWVMTGGLTIAVLLGLLVLVLILAGRGYGSPVAVGRGPIGGFGGDFGSGGFSGGGGGFGGGGASGRW
ncbi:MAG: TPM domain-containing protein [Kiritimatiellia bacterium]